MCFCLQKWDTRSCGKYQSSVSPCYRGIHGPADRQPLQWAFVWLLSLIVSPVWVLVVVGALSADKRSPLVVESISLQAKRNPPFIGFSRWKSPISPCFFVPNPSTLVLNPSSKACCSTELWGSANWSLEATTWEKLWRKWMVCLVLGNIVGI